MALNQGSLPRETHHGFAQHEYEATKTFFDAYGILRPAIPLLNPEFQNPLFLKLFCKGLKNLGLTKIPKGLHGITTVFDFLITSVNEKLSTEEVLSFDKKQPVVRRALNKVAEAMAGRQKAWLPREEAIEVVNAALPTGVGYHNSLFRHLVSEGLLAEDRVYAGNDTYEEAIRLTYERFADHLIIANLMERHIDESNPSASFSPGTPLGVLVEDEFACYRNRGLLEALAIQLPEKIGKELPEVVPNAADYLPVRMSFVKSLVWRKTSAFADGALTYINSYVLRWKDSSDALLDAFLTVAAEPDHPYNADRLHNYLIDQRINNRDAGWSIFLHEQYGEHEAVDRLVDWAWSPESKEHIGDEAILLSATALAWFLTTSNRFLRDRATKALVSLLTPRIPLIMKLIEKFLHINDPYVLERLYAAAYGCVLRSVDVEAITNLAKWVYEQVFQGDSIVPHLLLRDYARGIVEYALHLAGAIEGIDAERIRPPYKSDWPETFPNAEETEAFGAWDKDMPDKEWGRVNIHSSVMGFGDFSRYVIGTNGDQFFWSRRRIGERVEPTQREKYETFLASLTVRQRKALERFELRRRFSRWYQNATPEERGKTFKLENEIPAEELSDYVAQAEKSFIDALGKGKAKVYEEVVVPFENNPTQEVQEQRFDLKLAQRWVIKKVFDLGWTTEQFGRFDRFLNYNRGDRTAYKAERIGKKYQWLAWHEFLARAADNLQVRRRYAHEEADKEYYGPWQTSRRDIDPSCLLAKTGIETWRMETPSWWSPSSYNAWARAEGDQEWLENGDDLPNAGALLDVVDSTGTSWLVMGGFRKWEEPVPPEEDRSRVPRREVWYILRPYIVRKEHAEDFYQWAIEQDFSGRNMPEASTLYRVFLGEFFWSPAYQYHHTSDYGLEDWTTMEDSPTKVLVPSVEYSAEGSGFDCSLNDGYRICLPSKWLAEGMGLTWRGHDGCFFDAGGKRVAFDPSVTQAGPGALLLHKATLAQFLEKNGYDIIWTLQGEKQVMPGWTSDTNTGWLTISGAYRFREGRIEGKLRHKPNEQISKSRTNTEGR